MEQQMSKPVLFFKGIFMGLSIMLPGISGGTMAFILGIYKKLIDEISRFHAGDFTSPRRFLKKYDWLFLTPLLTGGFFAVVLFVFLAPPLITAFQFEFYSLVFGFVLAGLYPPLKEVEKNRKTLILFVFFAFVSVSCFVGTGATPFPREEVSLLWIFPAGALVSLALVVPGLSGSYLLILFGLYHSILKALRDLDLPVVSVFMAGAFLGLLLMARAMRFLLNRFPSETLSAVLGLVAGSLFVLQPFSGPAGGTGFFSSSLGEKLTFLCWFSLSFCLTLFIGFFYGKTSSRLLK